MDEGTHIIDPDGEVVIIVHNPYAPFAVCNDENAPAEEPADSRESLSIIYSSYID
jgi:hypothetical protein